MSALAHIRHEDLRRRLPGGQRPRWLDTQPSPPSADPDPDMVMPGAEDVAAFFADLDESRLPDGHYAIVTVASGSGWLTHTVGKTYTSPAVALGQQTRMRNSGRWAFVLIAERHGGHLTVWTSKMHSIGDAPYVR